MRRRSRGGVNQAFAIFQSPADASAIFIARPPRKEQCRRRLFDTAKHKGPACGSGGMWLRILIWPPAGDAPSTCAADEIEQ